MGNDHMDLGHHMGVPKLLTWSIHSLGEPAHLEHTLCRKDHYIYRKWNTVPFSCNDNLQSIYYIVGIFVI